MADQNISGIQGGGAGLDSATMRRVGQRLIPFLLLLTFGLDQALKKFGDAVKFGVLTILLLAMLAAEISIDWQVFPSGYNWFHQ